MTKLAKLISLGTAYTKQIAFKNELGTNKSGECLLHLVQNRPISGFVLHSRGSITVSCE
jgi:hypothetical protein